MNDPEERVEIGRRQFLKTMAGYGAGAAIGLSLIPVKIAANEAVEDYTDFDAGNAGLAAAQKAACSNAPDEEQCAIDYMKQPQQVIDTVVKAPIIEEMIFRGIPSGIVNTIDSIQGKDTKRVPLHGTESKKLDRKEIIAGCISTTIFAGVHNLTETGFNTRSLPVSQAIGGLSLWYIARKFGMPASMLAHAANNGVATFIN